MQWMLSHRFDKPSRIIADRHYNRQKIGSPQFVAPGEPLVLIHLNGRALWVSLLQKFQDHEWQGAWVCSTFRNEDSGDRSSDLIREAVAATRFRWDPVPAQGMITFINPRKIRHKRDPGRCFLRAGFKEVGMTKVNKLIVLQILEADMPAPEPCANDQQSMAL